MSDLKLPNQVTEDTGLLTGVEIDGTGFEVTNKFFNSLEKAKEFLRKRYLGAAGLTEENFITKYNYDECEDEKLKDEYGEDMSFGLSESETGFIVQDLDEDKQTQYMITQLVNVEFAD